MTANLRLALLCAAAAAAVACHGGSSQTQTTQLTRDQSLDATSCASCHQDHYSEWAGSMHAYSSNDPVFLAMNKRGQRETNGALGNFCVNCHAPMAVREGATVDGLNLDTVPQKLKGVTCFFCHSVQSVDGAHNNPLTLATDLSFRGGISDPYNVSRPHGATYSPLMDRNRAESATTCGSCHDIVSPPGAPIERTLTEWQASAFSTESGTTCGQCHMPQSTDDRVVANVPNAPLRRPHSHTFPAIDTALTSFPDTQRQKDQVQALLDTSLQTALCVEPFGGGSKVSVIIDNVAAGHAFPSGSSQDRRVWVEVVAYQGTQVIYQSGVIPDGQEVAASTDPDLWLMRDCMFDTTGKQVNMFWQAASVDSDPLPALTTFDISAPTFYQTHKLRNFPITGAAIATPDRITMRVHVRPMGLDVLDDLIASNDLDPSVRGSITTLNVGAVLEWTAASANKSYFDRNTNQQVLCKTDTNLNVQADKFPATQHTKCSP